MNRPNILLLFPDQWRWDYLGCEDGPYGKMPVRTPTIDRLAARGVRFTQCRTNSPLCSPARACLALMSRYDRCGCPGNDHYTPTDRATVFNLLRDAGYHTMTCGKSDLFKPDDQPTTGYLPIMDEYGFSAGIDHRGKGDAIQRAKQGKVEPYTAMLRERGLLEMHLADHPDGIGARGPHASPLPDDAHTDSFCGANALKLLDEAPAGKPWCLWVNFPGPHNPFDPPADALAEYADVDFPPPVGVDDPSSLSRDPAADRRSYAASCTHIDTWIGRILDRIEQRGEMDSTVILLSADHGEMVGDHGRWAKSVPQEGSVHVPLIAAGPGIRRGAVNDGLVELIDVAATMLSAADLPVPDGVDACSFWPVLTGRTDDTGRDVQLSGLHGWRMAFDGRYKYVRREDSGEELYDLQADPAETRNLADELPDVTARLRRIVEEDRAA